MSRKPEEINAEYSQLCMKLGDLTAKSKAIQRLVSEIEKRIDDLAVEMEGVKNEPVKS